MTITKITNIDNKKHIALLDTSSISFMQGLHEKGITSEEILKDYDLILIPEWVLLLFALPLFLDITGVWIAMPISEFIVAVVALLYIYKRT